MIKSNDETKEQLIERITSLGCESVRGILLRADSDEEINEIKGLNEKDYQSVISELRFIMKIKDT